MEHVVAYCLRTMVQLSPYCLKEQQITFLSPAVYILLIWL